MLNDPKHPDHIPGARVVAGFPGGSPDIPLSIDRVPQYVATLRDKWGVPHVFGKTDADAAFGLAYAHAEDDWPTIQGVLAASRGTLAGSTSMRGSIPTSRTDG